ncbi:Acetyltransferase (GNAT) family protein [Planctomycetes bacterium MalM25]|nr:Acetyltransferase (GNAT) family protein [Planctomycetes bacterium MalM25]
MLTMPLPVRPHRLTEIREDEALAIGRMLAMVWPKPDRGAVERAEQIKRYGVEYSGPIDLAPISYVVWEGEEAAAHALTFERTVATPTGEIPVMALAMVAADPACRGKGYGAAVAQAAFERVDAGDFPFALFQTSHAVQPFYERLGCRLVENRIVNSLSESDPAANPFWDDIVMRYPGGGEWPEGDIDLRGRGY